MAGRAVDGVFILARRVCARVGPYRAGYASNPFPQEIKFHNSCVFFPGAFFSCRKRRKSRAASSAFRASETKIPIYYYNPARLVSRRVEKKLFGPGVNAFV